MDYRGNHVEARGQPHPLVSFLFYVLLLFLFAGFIIFEKHYFGMGSLEEHTRMVKEVYEIVVSSIEKTGWDDVDKELEYGVDRVVGEFDILLVDAEHRVLYYGEVKSGKNTSYGKKQLERAAEYFADYGFEVYGDVITQDNIDDLTEKITNYEFEIWVEEESVVTSG